MSPFMNYNYLSITELHKIFKTNTFSFLHYVIFKTKIVCQVVASIPVFVWNIIHGESIVKTMRYTNNFIL